MIVNKKQMQEAKRCDFTSNHQQSIINNNTKLKLNSRNKITQ